ncbi:MAG: FecR domain-containing protein [Flavisolibacter sp.]|nr:FecR domain-containing protein [Flavisolibacter sp.]
MDNKLENKFYRLFALKLSGEASAEELECLEAILGENPELRFLYDQLVIKKAEEKEVADLAEQAYAAHFAKLHVQKVFDDEKKMTFVPRPKGSNRKIARYATAAVILLIAGVLISMPREKQESRSLKSEMATTKKSKSTISLPDGTVVMLNANSRISYNEKFKGDTREVTLSGEAYFDVAHDAVHPFIVHTKTGDIKVLGTTFNVKAFDNGFFETALIHGKVAIYLKNHGEENFVLSPGQKFVAHGKEDKKDSIKIIPITVVKDSIVAETSWTSNQLAFANTPLVEIAEELERKFGVSIVFKSATAEQYRYSGVFDDGDLDQIFEILKLSKSFNYHRDKDSITIE